MSFTVNSEKDLAQPRRPVLLCDFTFSDGTVWRAATIGANWAGHTYVAALSDQNLDRAQALSEMGIDRVPSVSISIADPDGSIYTTWERGSLKGFRGATLLMRLALMDVVTGEFSTDSIVPFLGLCDQPTIDEKGLTVTAQNKLNLSALQLPLIPISQRCPWINPVTTQQRAEASDVNSRFFRCGETRDLTTAPPCSYTTQTCTQPTHYGGSTWQTAKQGSGREYITGNKVQWVNPDTSGKLKQYWPQWLGGAAWVDVPILNQWADGNYSRGEAAIGVGMIDVLRVIANGIELDQASSGDFRWHYVNHGSRSGAHNTDTGYSNGDVYGNETVIQFLAPHSVIDPNSTATLRVLGRKSTATASISVVSAAGSGTGPIRIEFGRVMGTTDPGDGTLVTITGSSWSAINGSFVLRYLDLPYDHAYLEGTIASGSGTGGTLFYASSFLGSGGAVPTTLVIQEALRACQRFTDPEFGTSWNGAAAICETVIDYTDSDGVATSGMRFSSAMALKDRRSVAEVVRGVRQSIGAFLYVGQTGLLEIFLEGPLAEQQPAAVDGSNYNTAITSTLRDGTTANGYAAYRFDESNSWGLKRVQQQNSTTPNKVTFNFLDPHNDWAVSTFSDVDPEDVSRLEQEVAGGLQVQPEGIASYNHAYRAATLGLAKVLRGNPSGDTRGTDWWEWQTSFRACKLMIGQIVLLNDTRLGLSNQQVRITGLKPTKNYESVTVTAHFHADIWYSDTPPTFADPNRVFYHYTPPPADTSSRVITASSAQLDSDNLVLCDTSSITGFTTTLSAAITDTTTATFTVAMGSNILDGTYVKIGSEIIGPVSGGGTTTIVGNRGALNTTAATHANAATVNIGGALSFSLLAIADWPDQSLILRKTTSDINYVKILAASGNTFPGGATQIILPSSTTDEGTTSLRSPGAALTEWVVLAGAGREGPPGPPGAAGVGTAAPNVLSATCAVSYAPVNHTQDIVFTVPATLDTGNADYSHDKFFEAYAVDPGGHEHYMDRVTSWTGSSITFTGHVGIQPLAGVSQTWKLKIYAYNEQDVWTDPPYTITGITVSGPSISALSGTDATGSRWADSNRSVYAPQTIGITSGPLTYTLWIFDGVQNNWHGWFSNVAGGATSFTIGLKDGKEVIFAPPASGTWIVKAAPGTWEGSDTDGWRCADLGLTGKNLTVGSGSAIPGLFASSSYTVAGMAKPLANEITALVVPAGAGGTFPYDILTDGIAPQHVAYLPSITYSDTGCNTSSSFVTLTITDLDASGAPVSAEQKYGVRPVIVQAGQNFGDLIRSYGSSGGDYPRTGVTSKVRLRCYVGSRKTADDNAWTDTTTYTLQTSIGSGGNLDIVIAVGGAEPTSLAYPLVQNSARALTTTVTDPSNILANWNFESGDVYWIKLGSATAITNNPTYSDTGSYYAHIGDAAGSAGISQYPMPCQGGAAYALKARVDCDPGITGSLFLTLGWYDKTGAFISRSSSAGIAGTMGLTYTDEYFLATAPAGASYFDCFISCAGAQADHGWNIDNIVLRPQVSTGDGTQSDGRGGVAVKTGNGTQINPTTRGVELKTGATIDIDGAGAAVVKSGTLGEGYFVGGALGNDLSKWSVNNKPYGWYFGLPSPTDPNVPSTIINTADSPNWKVYVKKAGGWDTAKTQPGDLVAGTITALVSLISPTIAGGSISGTSLTIASGSATINIDSSNMIKITDPTFTRFTRQNATSHRVESTLDSTRFCQLILGQVGVQQTAGGSGGFLNESGTLQLFGTPGTVGVYINGTKVL